MFGRKKNNFKMTLKNNFEEQMRPFESNFLYTLYTELAQEIREWLKGHDGCAGWCTGSAYGNELSSVKSWG